MKKIANRLIMICGIVYQLSHKIAKKGTKCFNHLQISAKHTINYYCSLLMVYKKQRINLKKIC